MKLQRTVIELDLYGEKLTQRKPTFAEASEYRKQLLSLSESEDASGLMANLLESLGLPKDKFQSLEFDHVNEIMQAVVYSKKN